MFSDQDSFQEWNALDQAAESYEECAIEIDVHALQLEDNQLRAASHMPQLVDSSDDEEDPRDDLFSLPPSAAASSPQEPSAPTPTEPHPGNPTDNRIRIPILVNRHKVLALVDTGAQRTLISQTLAAAADLPVKPSAVTITTALKGCSGGIHGTTQTTLLTSEHQINNVHLLVADLPPHIDMYIGMDTLPSLGIRIEGLPTEFPFQPGNPRDVSPPQ